MKKYLKELKPNNFDDLIAMNALYSLGQMEYIQKNPSKVKYNSNWPISKKIIWGLQKVTSAIEEIFTGGSTGGSNGIFNGD